MHTRFLICSLLTIFVLTACSTAPAASLPDAAASAANAALPSPGPAEPQPSTNSKPAFANLWVEEVPRIDEQGAVIVEITPLNPNNPGYTLDFFVALNTHSVDLDMDLAALATLETSTGLSLPASSWDAPSGGHHVKGVLSFPADVNGTPVLANTNKMTLRLVNLDAPERTFTWER